jgi:hypothetical protein
VTSRDKATGSSGGTDSYSLPKSLCRPGHGPLAMGQSCTTGRDRSSVTFVISALAYLGLAIVALDIYRRVGLNDAHAYWAAEGYAALADQPDAFLYTPPILLALQPFQLLPWDVFRALFLAGQVAALVWMTGPVVALLLVLPGPWSPVWTDLWFGNVMIFTGALAVAGFRNPYWWSVLPFLKVTPGVALLWNGWRPIVVGVAVAAVSAVLFWQLWLDWWAVVSASSGAHPLAGWLLPRLVIATALVLVGRWRGWRWTVPLAVMLAQPILWYTSFAILAGWVWLLRQSGQPSGRTASAPLRTACRRS